MTMNEATAEVARRQAAETDPEVRYFVVIGSEGAGIARWGETLEEVA